MTSLLQHWPLVAGPAAAQRTYDPYSRNRTTGETLIGGATADMMTGYGRYDDVNSGIQYDGLIG